MPGRCRRHDRGLMERGMPRDISVMLVYITCEVAVVVHGTVQNDRRFRHHAGQGGGL